MGLVMNNEQYKAVMSAPIKQTEGGETVGNESIVVIEDNYQRVSDIFATTIYCYIGIILCTLTLGFLVGYAAWIWGR